MDDTDEEKIIQQAIYSQMKFTIRLFSNPFFKSILRPEIIFFVSLFFIICFYLQAIELNASGFINRISNTIKFKTATSYRISNALELDDSVFEIKNNSAVFSLKGRRLTQEDR